MCSISLTAGAAGVGKELGAVPPKARRDPADAHTRDRGFLRGKGGTRRHQAERVGGAAEQHHRAGEVFDDGESPRLRHRQHGRLGRYSGW